MIRWWGDYLRLESVKFVFCLKVYAQAECTMNEKFSIQYDAELNRLYGRVYTQKIEKR